MTKVELIDPTILSVQWNTPVDVNALTANNFVTQPSSTHASSLAQISPQRMFATMQAEVEDDTSLQYVGNLTGIATPQDVQIT